MTLWDVIVAAPRRWYLVIIGVLATLLALHLIQARPAVYYSQAQAVFLVPSSRLVPNKLEVRQLDLVVTAGVVAKRINGTDALPKTSTTEATSVDRNVLNGTLITLPDHGNQWAPNYDTGALQIEVSAATPEMVRRRMDRAYQQITSVLAEVQTEQHVKPDEQITVERSSEVPPVQVLDGRPHVATIMTVMLGASMTLIAIGLVELRSRRRLGRVTASAPGSDS